MHGVADVCIGSLQDFAEMRLLGEGAFGKVVGLGLKSGQDKKN